jgi:hypothetical protein
MNAEGIMKKATKVEMGQRTHEVTNMLLSGASRGDILRIASEKWGASERTADTHISRARAILHEQAEAYRQSAFAEHIAARRALRKLAHEREDWRLVLELLRDEAKLLGLYAAEIEKKVVFEQRVEGYDYHKAIAPLEPKGDQE